MENMTWRQWAGVVVFLLGVVVIVLVLSAGSNDRILGNLSKGLMLIVFGGLLISIKAGSKQKK